MVYKGPRHRERDRNEPGGHFTPQIGGLDPYYQDEISPIHEEMDDVVGYPDVPNTLILERTNTMLGRTTGDIGAWYANDAYTVTGVWDHLGLPTGALSDNSAMSKTLAFTNPSRPHIDVPAFVGELKDMPRMLKEVGRFTKHVELLAKKGKSPGGIYDLINRDYPLLASKGFVGWNFGWAPLISDLNKMLGFTQSADKRFEDIRRLAKNKGLSRRQDTWKDEAFSGPHDVYTPVAYGANLRTYCTVVTEGKQWCTTRWVPLHSEMLPRDGTSQRKLADSLVRGLASASAAPIWELLPWSWLFDWFSNAGERIATTRNDLNLIAMDQCVMEQHVTRLKTTSKVDTPQTGRFSPNADWGRVTKTRHLVTDPIHFEASVPLLSLKQFSILSGLAIQNLGRLL